MKRKPRIEPLHCSTRSAAAFAEPPVIQCQSASLSIYLNQAHTGSNDVVHDKNLLPLLDSVLLHLEEVGTIFLDVLGSDARARKLALLADSSEADAEPQSKAGAKEETAGIEANNDIGHASSSGSLLANLDFQSIEQSSMCLGVGKQGHDVNELDTRDREVAERTEGGAESAYRTGEFGGGGGGGGGLSSRGILGGGGRRRRSLSVWWEGVRHCGGKEGERKEKEGGKRMRDRGLEAEMRD